MRDDHARRPVAGVSGARVGGVGLGGAGRSGADLTGYRGEVSRRYLAAAILLNLLMPGLGFVYNGRLRRGVGIYLATALAFVTFAGVAWGANLFLPRAALIGVTGWIYLQVTMALRLRRALHPPGGELAGGELAGGGGPGVGRPGDDYVLARFNHPMVYIGLFLALEAVPAWLFVHFATENVVVSFVVSDRNTFPELLVGDRVYGRREGIAEAPPERGELLVVGRPDEGGSNERLSVMRVMAVPGDEVAMEGGSVIVNGIPRYRERLGAIELVGEDPAPAEIEPIRPFREFADRHSYEIYVPRDVEPQDRPPRRLLDGEYFLLADLRDVEGVRDSRVLGPIGADRLVGRPLWIWWSADARSGRIRWRRIGLPVD